MAEAIDNDNVDNLREETGDVLLQVVFHSLLAEEEGKFDLRDVANEECEKMIRRHPHVFLSQEAKSIDKVLEKWENIKKREHKDEPSKSKLGYVPKAFPALIRSNKVQKKAAQLGFDWDDVKDAFQKIEEEKEELLEACDNSSQSEIIEEMGDLLFAVVNVSRLLKIEPESALELATEKFIRRFDMMYRLAAEAGHELSKMDLTEMNELWEEVKHRGF